MLGGKKIYFLGKRRNWLKFCTNFGRGSMTGNRLWMVIVSLTARTTRAEFQLKRRACVHMIDVT